jgi:hypothetical protein
VALPTLVVLVLIGCGFRSVEAVTFGTKHPNCNSACGQKGATSGAFGTDMTSSGATPQVNKCYRCWDTAWYVDCPAGTPLRSAGNQWDTCCDAAYDCSCSVSEQCTSSEVGDGKCQEKCKVASCGNDGSDCSGTAPIIPTQYCPCCYDKVPKYMDTTKAREEEGYCWHCYDTPPGGKCSAGHLGSGGIINENCCHKVARDKKTVCTTAPDPKTCNKEHADPAGSGLDGVIDAAGGVLDAASGAVSAINPLSDLKPIEPSCVLKVDSCAGICTFGFRSAKSSLTVQFALGLDVQSASRGTATFEGFANGKSLIKGNHDFKKGDSDQFCIPVNGLAVPGLGLSLCLDLDPNQAGSFTLQSEVLVELFVRISVIPLIDYKVSLGSKRASWSCPNIPLIVGCVVGAVLLLGLSCFGYYRFRKAKAARLPSNPLGQTSVVNPHGNLGFSNLSMPAQDGPAPMAGPAGYGAPPGGAMPASVTDTSGCGVWEPQKDLQTGKIYWTNHVLQKTTWDPPTVGTPVGYPVV